MISLVDVIVNFNMNVENARITYIVKQMEYNI